MSPDFRGLATVTRGLQFFCAGSVVLAVALIVPLGAAPWLGILLDFIGRTCCLTVPRKSWCLGLVRASVLCSLIAFALTFSCADRGHQGNFTGFFSGKPGKDRLVDSNVFARDIANGDYTVP
jgi:hypothetical protein